VTSFYRQLFQGTINLGINHYGVHVLNPREMKLESWHFKDLTMWDFSLKTFVFEVATGVKSDPIRRYTFTTTQAELINDLMDEWAEEWEKTIHEQRATSNKKGEKKDRRKQTIVNNNKA